MLLDNLTENLKTPEAYFDAKDKRTGKPQPLKLKGKPVDVPDLDEHGSKKDKGKKSKKQEAVEALRDVLTEGDSE